MKRVLVLGPGCSKCKLTYQNVIEAVKQANVSADVQKIEDIEEMLKYDILTTPTLLIDGKQVISGRVPDVAEIKKLLLA